MKLLKIDNKQGHYLDESGEYLPIDRITKDQLLRIVNLILSEDVELDEYDDNEIRNQAHQIVYKSIYMKLHDLKERKEAFIDESERLYLPEYERYRDESSKQSE